MRMPVSGWFLMNSLRMSLQYLHGLIGPLDALFAEIGQFHAFYIT